MATLTETIGTARKTIRVSAALGIDSRYPIPLTIGSEHVVLNAEHTDEHDLHYIQVDRGQDGTTPAAHSSGTTVTAGWGSGSSGSGVTVDNGTDPPAAVTTLVAQGAVIDGNQATLVATYTLGPVRVEADDPDLDWHGDYIRLFTVPPGALVLAVKVFVRDVGWDAGSISVAAADGAGGQLFGLYKGPNGGPDGNATTTADPQIAADANLAFSRTLLNGADATDLFVYADIVGTTGSVDVVAIIATPS